MIFKNTDQTDPVVSLERNSEGVLIVHPPVQFEAASAGPEMRVIVIKRVK